MKDKKLDLIIVGAQKAGTTSLNNYLRSHPNISGHSIIEFSYFADQKEFDQGFEKAYNRYFEPKENNNDLRNTIKQMERNCLITYKRNNWLVG